MFFVELSTFCRGRVSRFARFVYPPGLEPKPRHAALLVAPRAALRDLRGLGHGAERPPTGTDVVGPRKFGPWWKWMIHGDYAVEILNHG